MRILAAVATDDGKTTNKKHFGDADFYNIYEISKDDYHIIKKIDNSSKIEEETHADPRKAKSVAEQLSAENVNTAVARVFGPNLKRIRGKFVCIMVKENDISDVLQKVKSNFKIVEDEWKKGAERNHLKL